MSISKMPVFVTFPAEKGQSRLVQWIKNNIYRKTSRRVNWILDRLPDGGIEIIPDGSEPGDDGNWRIVVSGNDLVIQRRVSSAWAEAQSILGTSTLGDIELPSNGNQISWPGGELTTGDDLLRLVAQVLHIGDPAQGETPINSAKIKFEGADYSVTLTSNQLATRLEVDDDFFVNGQLDVNGDAFFDSDVGIPEGDLSVGEDVTVGDDLQVIGATQLIGLVTMNDDVVMDTDLRVLNNIYVTNKIYGPHGEIGGSSRLFGSSTEEFLVAAEYVDIVQDGGANKFELRLTAEFTGGSDTDYEIEIDTLTGGGGATYKWRKDTGGGFGAYTEEVAVVLGFTELDEGILISWLNSGSDAFVVGDAYSFTAVASPTEVLNVDTQNEHVQVSRLLVGPVT